LGDPGLGLRDGVRLGLCVEEDGRDVHSRDPVHKAVVRLRHQGEAPALDAIDKPHLPQGLRAIEALGEDARGEREKLLGGPGLGKRGVADVVREVELRVVDPSRAALPQRHEAEFLAESRHKVKARFDVVAQLLVFRGRSLEESGRGHVHVRGIALQMEEGRVEPTQTVGIGGHGANPPTT
jgi:hypothetical protein